MDPNRLINKDWFLLWLYRTSKFNNKKRIAEYFSDTNLVIMNLFGSYMKDWILRINGQWVGWVNGNIYIILSNKKDCKYCIDFLPSVSQVVVSNAPQWALPVISRHFSTCHELIKTSLYLPHFSLPSREVLDSVGPPLHPVQDISCSSFWDI